MGGGKKCALIKARKEKDRADIAKGRVDCRV